MGQDKLRRILLLCFFTSLCLSVALQQATLGLLLAFLAYSYWQEGRVPYSPLDRSLLFFFAALLLSSFFSPDVSNSLAGYRKLWLVGAFFVTYHLIGGPREAERLVTLMVSVAVVVAVYGIIQHFTGIDLARQLMGKAPNLDPFWFGRQEGFRTKGLHPSGITYAHNLLTPLIFGSVLLFAPSHSWPKRLAVAGGWGVIVFALLFSLTRGVWVAYAFVLLLLGIIRGGKALLGVICSGIVLGVFLLAAGAGVQERAWKAFDFTENLPRSQIWQANLDMIKDRSLLGWGYGNYKKFRAPYYQRYPQVDTTAHAHNNFLQMWVEGGLLGLSAFLLLFWTILVNGWRAYHLSAKEPLKSLALGGVLSIAGFLLGGLTQYNFGDAEVVIVMWAVAGLVLRIREWVAEK